MLFFLYFDLIKITLQIMLNYFEEKKETFLTINSRIFQTPKNRIFFFKGVNPCFWLKNTIFSLFWFDQNKTRNNAFWISREKKTFFGLTKTVRIFESPKNRIFSKGLTHALGQKMPIFTLIRLGQNKTRNNS